MNGRGGKKAVVVPRGRGKAPQNRTNRPRRNRSVERAAPVSYGEAVGPSPTRAVAYSPGRVLDTQPEIILQVTAQTTDQFITIPIIPEMLFDPGAMPGYGGDAEYMAGLSQLHSQHRWQSLSFVWTPSCPTTTPGNVVLKFFPNWKDPLPTSLIRLMDTSSLTISPYMRSSFKVTDDIGGLKNNIGPVRFLDLTDEDKADYSIGRLVVGTTAQVSKLSLGILQMFPRVVFSGPQSTQRIEASSKPAVSAPAA